MQFTIGSFIAGLIVGGIFTVVLLLLALTPFGEENDFDE